MVNEKHLDLIKKGITTWNEWRMKNPDERIDLSGANLALANLIGANLREADLSVVNLFKADLNEADLSGANLALANLAGAKLFRAKLHKTELFMAILAGAHLRKADLREAILRKANFRGALLFRADFSEADLHEADLREANLREAILHGANLREAILREANLREANLHGADLRRANLRQANLREADLHGADLRGADLSEGNMVGTNFNEAKLTGCRIYGVSAWDLKLQGTVQLDLIITPHGYPDITVDNLEVAQFIYLLLNNEKIRDVIDTITSKIVLILGNFSDERKKILNALRKELRNRNYSPVLFDFEPPYSRNLMETVTLLARMARFIIADITGAKSIAAELQAIVPDLPSVPIRPLMLRSDYEYALFESIKCYPSVLEVYLYDTCEGLLKVLGKAVITPAEKKLQEIREKSSRN